MAAANISFDVSCGVSERDPGSITLIYTVSAPKITWEWKPKEGNTHIAVLTAYISDNEQRRHESKPIPDVIYCDLGQPKKTVEGNYYKVKMSRKNKKVSIEEYFNT